MLALYIIVGIISAAFVTMLCFGCRRAVRDPQRYGWREGDEENPPQTAASGLAQAILDTFPVIKFTEAKSRPPAENREGENGEGLDDDKLGPSKSIKSEQESSFAMVELHRDDPSGSSDMQPNSNTPSQPVSASLDHRPSLVRPMSMSSGVLSDTGTGTGVVTYHDDMAAVSETTGDNGGGTCAICIADYVEGDILRQVQCDGKHMYHKRCIDLWFQNQICCPLCRKGE